MPSPTSFLELDSHDPKYAALCAYAGRVGKLLTEPGIQSDDGATASLDLFLGAIHAFLLAQHAGYRDRTSRAPKTSAVQVLAGQIHRGRLRDAGVWLAGFHFNSGLMRLSAVFHRALKIIAKE